MANKRRITLSDIKGTPIYEKNKHLFDAPREKPKIVLPKPVSKEKSWLSWNLSYWCNERALTLETEVEFMEFRKYRFDWAIPSLMVACEYEGIMQQSKGHTSPKHYTKDTEKYTQAAMLGWVVMRYTAINYKRVLQDLDEYYKNFKK